SFAFACRARLVRRFGTPVKIGSETVWAFPAPARLARASVPEIRALKYSTRKAEYIRDLARAIVDGTLDLEALCAAESAIVIAELTALRGLGRWTADWFSRAAWAAAMSARPAISRCVRRSSTTTGVGGRSRRRPFVAARARGVSTRISPSTTSSPACV